MFLSSYVSDDAQQISPPIAFTIGSTRSIWSSTHSAAASSATPAPTPSSCTWPPRSQPHHGTAKYLARSRHDIKSVISSEEALSGKCVIILVFHRFLLHASMRMKIYIRPHFSCGAIDLFSGWAVTASRTELPHTFFTVINIRSTSIIIISAAAAYLNDQYQGATTAKGQNRSTLG